MAGWCALIVCARAALLASQARDILRNRDTAASVGSFQPRVEVAIQDELVRSSIGFCVLFMVFVFLSFRFACAPVEVRADSAALVAQGAPGQCTYSLHRGLGTVYLYQRLPDARAEAVAVEPPVAPPVVTCSPLADVVPVAAPVEAS